jgi:hypothetical protein
VPSAARSPSRRDSSPLAVGRTADGLAQLRPVPAILQPLGGTEADDIAAELRPAG